MDETQARRLRDPIYKLAGRLQSMAAIAQTENLSTEEKQEALTALLGEVRWHVEYMADRANLRPPGRQAYGEAFKKGQGVANHLAVVLDAGGVHYNDDEVYQSLYDHARELAQLARTIIAG